MKTMSRVALVAALFAGASGLAVVAPATAAKKEKPPKVEPLKLGEAVRKPLSEADAAIKAKNWPAAEAALTAADAVVSTNDERYYAAVLRVQTYAGSGQNDKLAAPLDALIANPRTPQDEKAKFNGIRGDMAYNAKQYAQAVTFYTTARQLGYQSDNLALQIARAKVEAGDINGGVAELDTAIQRETAAGRKAPEAWYRYAVGNLNRAKNAPATATWARRWVAAYPSAENWRTMVIVYLDTNAKTLDKGQRLDMFRLLRAAHALADQADYAEYADLAYQTGLPWEAQNVIQEGRTAGKIPAAYTPANELLTLSKEAIAREGSFAELERKAGAASTGALSSQTADAFLGSGNYAKAITLYRQALQKGVTKPADVNTHLAIALILSGDREAAKPLLASVTAPPRSDIAQFWQFYLEQPATAGSTPAQPPA